MTPLTETPPIGLPAGPGTWPAPLTPATPDLAAPDLAALAREAGLGRVHVLAWRDLDDPEAGGSEVHAHAIVSRWAAAGVDVTMRTSAVAGGLARAERAGYRVVRRAGRLAVFPRAVVAEAAGRHGRRDALVEVWNGMPWFSPVWAGGPRVVWLHHIHGPMWGMTLKRRHARVGEAIERRIAPPLYRRSRVVTLAESSRRELVETFGFDRARVHVVAPGVDRRFCPGPEAERSGHPLVVAVGRLAPVKRFVELVAVMSECRRRVPDLELVVVGEGEQRAAIEAAIWAHGAERWARLAGRVDADDLVALYRRAWVVTSASIAEGWGMTITEAAACATPAVVTDIAGHRDAVVDDVTGVLAPLDGLAPALATVLTDPDRRRRLGEAAHRRAATFTWDATAAGTLAALALEARHRRR